MRRFSSAMGDRSRRSNIGSKIESIAKIRRRRQRPTLDPDHQEHLSEVTDDNERASIESDTTSHNRQQFPASPPSSSSTASGVSQVVLDGTDAADSVAELTGPSAPGPDRRSVVESSAQQMTSLADDAQQMTSLADDAHQMTSLADDAQQMTSLADDDVEVVTLAVSCGANEAQLRLNDLRGGSRRSCVLLFDGSWVTPNEFQAMSGRGNAKDWKRSIRHHGRPLKFLMERGLLSTTPPFCLCHVCHESQGRENSGGIGGGASADVKPTKRTKISSNAKEYSLAIGRRKRKNATAIDLNPEETRTRRKIGRKTKQNETIDRNNGNNQYGRRRRRGRRAQDCGKTKTLASTRRRRCNDKMATRTENFEQLLEGTEKSGRSTRGEVEGERVEAREKAFELCDDDSRTIIDGEELFAAAVAAAAAADGGSPSGSGVVSAAFQEIVAGREENPTSFEISVAKDGVALCETARPQKRGRKRKAATMMTRPPSIDETKREDEKRAKIEDESDEFAAEPVETESQEADDETVPELNKSPEEDDVELNGSSRLGKDELGNAESKEVDKLNETHPDRSQTMKLWRKEISDYNGDDRTSSTKPATGSYDSEDFRNPLKDQSYQIEDTFSGFLTQSTLFTSQKKDFDSKEIENGRQFTAYRQSSAGTTTTTSSSSRGSRRRRSGRGGVTSKMADSTTIFDARSHATMTSSSVPIDYGWDYVNGFSRSGDLTLGGVKTRRKRVDRMRPGSDVTETKSLHLSQWKLPEAGKRFDEFPVGNFPETLFGNSPNDDDIRFHAAAMTSSLLPVSSLRYLRGLCSSGLDLDLGPRPSSSSGLYPHEEPPGGQQQQRRRPRGPRQRRNGVVSSTTFDLPSSAEPMTSSYDQTTMTSLYRQQTSSAMTSAFQRDLYRRTPPGGFLFYAQGAPLERGLRPMDLYCGGVVEGGASLAMGRGVMTPPPPGADDPRRLVYDECGALDLTVPKVRSP